MNIRRSVLMCCCALLLSLACGSALGAETTEKNYIVYFNDSALSLQSADTVSGVDFSVLSETELQECLNEGIVEWYEEDFSLKLFTEDSITDNPKWHLDAIKIGKSRSIHCTGQEIRVAVIDTGIVSHSDLLNNIEPGYNYLANSTDVTDNHGHGTFIAGLIAAELNNIGIDGIAPNTKIIPLKCADADRASVSAVITAIRAAVDVYDCDIINLSLGTPDYSVSMKNAVDYAVEHGVCVVAAVGNDGNDVLQYPAAFDNVIGVGSVNSENAVSSFSQKNSSVCIVAPGEELVSTNKTGNYAKGGGTSFSAPIVVGAVSVLLNIGKYTPAEITDILTETAVDIGAAGYDTDSGYGVLDCEAAVNYALRDTDYFISPIETSDGHSSAFVYNNTGSPLSALLLFGKYRDKRLIGFENSSLAIESQQVSEVGSSLSGERLKCFIWSNIGSMTILSDIREFLSTN